ARKSDRDRRGHCAMATRLRFAVWCFALSDSIRIPAQTDLQTGAQPLNLLHNLSPCYPICYRGGSRTRHSTYYPGSCGHTRLLQRRLGCLGTLQPMIPLSSLFLASRNRVEPDPAQRRAVRGMIHCVTVHARHNRRKPALSGCRDSERSRACAFAVASLDVSLNRLIGDSFRRLWIAWTPMPTTSRSRAGIIWWR